MKIHRPRLVCSSGLILLFALMDASLANAQTVFVSLAGKTNVPPVLSIPAPGHGWNYSAAAAVDGDKWNRVRRPDPLDVTDPSIRNGDTVGNGVTGCFPLGNAETISLVDPDGNPTSARLGISLSVTTLAIDKPRSEPAFHSKSRDATPVGLMDQAWRVYLEKNALIFTVTGLTPGKPYDLYIYAAAHDVQEADNPSGNGRGGSFTLPSKNTPAGTSVTVETQGGAHSKLYTENLETGAVAIRPAGTTWARLQAVVDAGGTISFSTARNASRNQYINGFQLVESRP